MAELETLRAEPRAKLGKGPAYQTRLKGFIPGIVYGGKDAPQPVQVEERGFSKLYGTGHLLSTLFMLELEGRKTRVIPRAVQLDPVTDRPVHVDFMRLAAGARIALEIPVHFRGQENSPGIKRGGVLNIVRHEVELYCPVENIPPFIEGDLSGLDIGDSLHISAFTLPEGVKPVIQNRDFTVATIAPPTTYTEETPTAAAAVPGAEGEAAAAEAGAGAAPGAAAPAAEKGKAPEKK
jgi:large subunit ribosomal protein L25